MESVIKIGIRNDNSVYNQGTVLPNKEVSNQDSIRIPKAETSGQGEKFNPRQKDDRREVTEAESKIMYGRRIAEYTYHEEVNRITIKIIDDETKEVIREIPPEKSIEILKQLMEIPGLFVDERR